MEYTNNALNELSRSLSATNVMSKDYRTHIMSLALSAVGEAHEEGRKAGRDRRDLESVTNVPDANRERLADTLRPVWAILRCTSPATALDAYAKHHLDTLDPPGYLADVVLEVQEILRAEYTFATALLDLWAAEGGECGHGVGLAHDCPGELIEDDPLATDDRGECHWQQFRPILRAALAAISTERIART